MQLKTCTLCKESKTVISFWKNSRSKDGLTYQCKTCIADAGKRRYFGNWKGNRQRIDANHEAHLAAFRKKCNDIKSHSGCFFCQEREPICLDFHHKNPEDKSLSVSSMINRHKSWEDISNEIGKCLVVCANCHRKIHAGILSISCSEKNSQTYILPPSLPFCEP